MSYRWLALTVLALSVAISGVYRWRARQSGDVIERRREGGAALAARAAGGLSGFGAILIHAIRPDLMTWATFPAPAWVPRAGAVLGVLTVPAVFWVFTSIGRNVSETVLTKTRHELVVEGPYRWVRHPLYAVGIALIVATGLMLTSWLVLLFGLVAFLVFRFVVIPIEERQLVATFGDEYRNYAKRTGALGPRLGSR
jgi:protein-S-isoprenylcysteine O-methyltransferase Ste14